MFPHLKDLTIAKIEILGDKEDKYYEEFNLIKVYTFDGGLTKFNDFMIKIKNYEWN